MIDINNLTDEEIEKLRAALLSAESQQRAVSMAAHPASEAPKPVITLDDGPIELVASTLDIVPTPELPTEEEEVDAGVQQDAVVVKVEKESFQTATEDNPPSEKEQDVSDEVTTTSPNVDEEKVITEEDPLQSIPDNTEQQPVEEQEPIKEEVPDEAPPPPKEKRGVRQPNRAADFLRTFESFPDDDKETKPGSPNYSISADSINIFLDGKPDETQVPLAIWARNPYMLHALAKMAETELEDIRNSNYDYSGNSEYEAARNTILHSEINAINRDVHANNFFAREGADWRNYLLSPDGQSKTRSPYVQYAPGSLGNSTDKIISSAMRALDLGSPLVVRLWHSGIVFSINPPGKDQRIALVDRLNLAHLDTLRRTNGLIHGTSTYYSNRIIIDAFMQLVTASNIDRVHWGNIADIMDHRDIQFMAWGLLTATYTRGYKLIEYCGGMKVVTDNNDQPVLDDNGDEVKELCAHIKESKIDLRLLPVIDQTMFTEWQRDFIRRPLNQDKFATLEDIERYQSEGEIHKEDQIDINENISIILKAPKARLHLDIGEEWINSVELAVDEMLASTASMQSKEEIIERQLQTTVGLDVAHWCNAMVVNGERTENRESINTIFRSLSNNPERREFIFDTARKTIMNRVGAICAIPTHQCPSCNTLSNVIVNNGTTIYTPLDMVSRFFTLTGLTM